MRMHIFLSNIQITRSQFLQYRNKNLVRNEHSYPRWHSFMKKKINQESYHWVIVNVSVPCPANPVRRLLDFKSFKDWSVYIHPQYAWILLSVLFLIGFIISYIKAGKWELKIIFLLVSKKCWNGVSELKYQFCSLGWQDTLSIQRGLIWIIWYISKCQGKKSN